MSADSSQKESAGKGSWVDGFVRISATFFYVGYLPKMPGTWGSIAGLVLSWVLPPTLLLYSVLTLSLLGFLIADRSRLVFGDSDPKPFVLDEVCGMILSVLWLPKSVTIAVMAFVLFRIADIWKPGPIRWLQNRPQGFSIMADDLAAGLAVNLMIQVILRLWR